MDGQVIDKIAQLVMQASKVETIEIKGKTFATGVMAEIKDKDEFPSIEMLSFNDLKSFAEIANNEKAQLIPTGKYWIKIDTQDRVTLVSDLADNKKRRNIPYEAKALIPTQNFGRNMDYESFVIWLRSSFVPNADTENLVKLIAGIVHSETQEMIDDGITQTVRTQKGTQSKSGEVKSIVKLAPYRTFAECEQPESEFLFRIQGNGTLFSLHEADGGKWKLAAKQNIKTYLDKVIKKDNGISILL